MVRRYPDRPPRWQLLGELSALLARAETGERGLRDALALLAALGEAEAAACYQAARGRAWRRRAGFSETGRLPLHLPRAIGEEAMTAPRDLDPERPGDAALLGTLGRAGRAGGLLLPCPAPGGLQAICLLAAREARPLGGGRRAALAQAGRLLGLWLAAGEQAAAARAMALRLAALSEGSADHIWELDARGRYCFNSEGAAQVLGYRPADLAGRRPLDFVHPEDRARLAAAIAEARAHKGPLGELVHRALAADGSEVYVESRAYPILDAAGRLLGYRGVDRNISDWFRAKRVMEETLIGTCEALGRMVELRDPYTKGHSMRVAALAVFLGRQLGRSTYELQGLQLMGLLHDIGKVGIPTEILSKPTRLNPEELELMRQHPQMGYEILKDISFPWPVAAAVLQHHERLDGSGYPQGLRGSELMWQVRALAVADLLEAMATDRPYRAGLGLEVALRELQQQRGLLYDPEIVDAALVAAARGELAAILDGGEPPAGSGAAPGPAAAMRLLELDLEPAPQG